MLGISSSILWFSINRNRSRSQRVQVVCVAGEKMGSSRSAAPVVRSKAQSRGGQLEAVCARATV